MPPEPPVPIFASVLGGLDVGVTFSRTLRPAILNVANWSVRYVNQRFTVASAVAAPLGHPDEVKLTLGAFAPEVGPDVVDFSPPPFDLRAYNTGTPAPAFVDYPIT